MSLDRTIIAFNELGGAVFGLVVPSLSCCDLYGNAGGDWTGNIEHLEGQLGNICADPMFCDLPGGDYAIEHDSPCCPTHNPCGLVGAGPVGCSATQAPEVAWSERGSFLACAPNPFTSETRIRWAAAGQAVLTIHDLAGRRVRTLAGAHSGADRRETVWDGRDDRSRPLAAGVYVCRLASSAGVLARRVLLLR